MTENKIYVGDIPLIRLDCGVDISAATLFKIKYRKPDQSNQEWTEGDGVEISGTQYLQYQTLATDLDQSGAWEFQVYLEIGSWKGHGETAAIRIYALFA